MTEKIDMPLSIALLLDDVINVLLKKRVTKEDGTIEWVDRTIPYRLRYRLSRNASTLDKDANEFEKKKLMLLAKYGEPTADGQNVAITDPEKLELYKKEMLAVLETVVSHSVVKLDREDLNELVEDIEISSDVTKVVYGYLVDDVDFINDINTEIKFKTYEPPKEESTPKIEEVKIENEPKEEVKVETSDTPKKKTSSKKSSTTTKKTTSKKKTKE